MAFLRGAAGDRLAVTFVVLPVYLRLGALVLFLFPASFFKTAVYYKVLVRDPRFKNAETD